MTVTKVLIVEDDSIISLKISFMLKEKGYDSQTASNSAEALEMVQSYQPDIVLMDIGLADGPNGIKTSAQIRQKHKELPIIYITGQDDDVLFEQAKSTYPKNYLSKPLEKNALYRAIELALQEVPATIPQVQGITFEGAFLRSKEGPYKKLLFKDLLYIEISKKPGHIDVHYLIDGKLAPEPYNLCMPATYLAEQLGYAGLMQLNRHIHANIYWIEEINDNDIRIHGRTELVSMSDKLRDTILSRLKKITKK